MTADPIGRELVAHLKRVGAGAVLLNPGAEAPDHELLLQLDVRHRGRPSAAAGFNWRCRDRSRPLAATLVTTVTAAAGLRSRGTRLSLIGGQGVAVRLTIELGRNPTDDLIARVLHGIYAGLIRHWALAAPLELLPGPVPEAAAAAEEAPPTAIETESPPSSATEAGSPALNDSTVAPPPLPPRLEPASGVPSDEPRITLYPDPSVVLTHPSRSAPDLDLKARITAVAGKVVPGKPTPAVSPGKAAASPPPFSPAEPQAPEPARPEPVPVSAYPILVTKVANPRAALVIRGKHSVYYDPLHPPGDSPIVPFARESAPSPVPVEAPDAPPAVFPQATIAADIPAAPEPDPDPIPVLSAPAFVAETFAPDPTPLDPAPTRTTIVQIPRPKDPRRTVQVIQHSSSGTVIRLS